MKEQEAPRSTCRNTLAHVTFRSVPVIFAWLVIKRTCFLAFLDWGTRVMVLNVSFAGCSRGLLTSMWSSIWWALQYFLLAGFAMHLLAMCPAFRQFIQNPLLFTSSHPSSRDIPWNLPQVFRGRLSLLHVTHGFCDPVAYAVVGVALVLIVGYSQCSRDVMLEYLRRTSNSSHEGVISHLMLHVLSPSQFCVFV